ncbi:M23 family metallopeptidase [Myxococcota bacterium]
MFHRSVGLIAAIGLVGCGTADIAIDTLDDDGSGLSSAGVPTYVDLEVGESMTFTTADSVDHTVTLTSQSLSALSVEVDGVSSTFDLNENRCGSQGQMVPRNISGVLVLPEVTSDIQNGCGEWTKDRRWKLLKVSWETGDVVADRDVENPGFARLFLRDPAKSLPSGVFPVETISCQAMLADTRRPFLVPSSYGFHHGVDLRTPVGTPLVAPLGGTLLKVHRDCPDGDKGCNGSCGNQIRVQGDDFKYYYCHMGEVEASLEVGDTVVPGQLLGDIAMTGLTSTPHLHFVIHPKWDPSNGSPFGGDPLFPMANPWPYLDHWCRQSAVPLPSSGAYGRIKDGDQSHIDRVDYSFGGMSGDVELQYEVWDVDFGGELRILLNGTEVEFPPTTNNEQWGGMQLAILPDSLVNDSSSNRLTFDNTSNPPNTYWWGVRNVSVGNGGSYTVYEDAEDELTTGWRVYDNTPAGAAYANVFDSERQSRVIELSGNGVNTGCHLRNADGSNWQNTAHKAIVWSMKYSEDFRIYVKTKTDAGTRYLTYSPVDSDGLGGGAYVWLGLGSNVIDGRWHTFARDLQADLNVAQPGVQIQEVNGIFIRGSGRLDDIMLAARPTNYEDAEDGLTNRWRVYDNTPAGAGLANVSDSERQSRVIELSGNGINTGCHLRNADGSHWKATDRKVISWSMNYSEDFIIYVRTQTTAGKRYLTYEPTDTDDLGGSTYVRLGLGSAVIDGSWQRISRDLQFDLARAQPGVEILEVNGIYVRGSGRLDDVELF